MKSRFEAGAPVSHPVAGFKTRSPQVARDTGRLMGYNELKLKATSIIKLSSPATQHFWEIPVLYEDEHLLALDKPAGLLTSPDRRQPDAPSLIALLHKAIAEQKSWVRQHNVSYLAVAHRLDAEASGILLLARSKPVLIELANLFGSEKPVQHFLALVNRAPDAREFEVDARLSPHPVRVGFVRIDPKHGKRSRTLVSVVEHFDGWTLVDCRAFTSRQHQIRVHLRHARCPVVADSLYNGKSLWLSTIKRDFRLKPGREERPLLGRIALHASRLALTHPVTGVPVEIESPLPHDFVVALKYLRKFAPARAPIPISEPATVAEDNPEAADT